MRSLDRGYNSPHGTCNIPHRSFKNPHRGCDFPHVFCDWPHTPFRSRVPSPDKTALPFSPQTLDKWKGMSTKLTKNACLFFCNGLLLMHVRIWVWFSNLFYRMWVNVLKSFASTIQDASKILKIEMSLANTFWCLPTRCIKSNIVIHAHYSVVCVFNKSECPRNAVCAPTAFWNLCFSSIVHWPSLCHTGHIILSLTVQDHINKAVIFPLPGIESITYSLDTHFCQSHRQLNYYVVIQRPVLLTNMGIHIWIKK